MRPPAIEKMGGPIQSCNRTPPCCMQLPRFPRSRRAVCSQDSRPNLVDSQSRPLWFSRPRRSALRPRAPWLSALRSRHEYAADAALGGGRRDGGGRGDALGGGKSDEAGAQGQPRSDTTADQVELSVDQVDVSLLDSIQVYSLPSRPPPIFRIFTFILTLHPPTPHLL